MTPRKQRVAIFGASGFIGSNLALALSTSGRFDLTLLDIVEDKLRQRLDGVPYRFVPCDISKDLLCIESVVQEHEIVIDLAAYVHPSSFLAAPLDVVQLNLFDTLNVVRACARHGRRLIHFSTSEVYGKTGGNHEAFREDETDCILGPIVNQRWIYSCGKQLLDRIIHAHALRGDLTYTLVRPFNFVGPLMDHLLVESDKSNPRVFAHFMSALLFERPLRLVDGGNSRRCFTYIDDATDAIALILEHREEFKNQIVNVGNPENETTIRDLAFLMREIYGREFARPNSPIQDVGSHEFYGEGYEDCDRRMPDISKLRRVGWVPKHNLEQTFERSMRYCWENREALLARPLQV